MCGKEVVKMSIYEIGKCNYCGSKNEVVRPTPFMADRAAMMCEECWDETQNEYAASNGEYIPDFQSDKEVYQKFIKEKVIDLFNQMQIEEVSAACGEIEYILVERNDKNIEILHEIGFSDNEINEECYSEEDSVYMDISSIAFKYADGFNGKTDKFYIEKRVF
jgi:predicted nucleic acid-binding Zn ribbon protein